MSNSLASYFISELEAWKESMVFYEQEVEKSLALLKTIIQMNTIPGLAKQVEIYFSGYERMLKFMKDFELKLIDFETELMEEELPIGNDLIGVKEIDSQKALRVEMQTLEKGYLTYKYSVDEFITETLIVQSKHA